MAVEVELFGQLASGAQRHQTLILEQPTTVGEVADRLGLNADTVGLVVIDGIQREIDDPVPPTCRLCFFPPVSGG
jgi:molybdopterin converting factor small subunit